MVREQRLSGVGGVSRGQAAVDTVQGGELSAFGHKPAGPQFHPGPFALFQNISGFSRPKIRRGLAVVSVHILAPGLLQFGHAMKDATPDALHRQITKEAFDPIQPGRTGGDPRKVKALVASQPLLHLGSLVGRVVIHDQMELLVWRRSAVNDFEALSS